MEPLTKLLPRPVRSREKALSAVFFCFFFMRKCCQVFIKTAHTAASTLLFASLAIAQAFFYYYFLFFRRILNGFVIFWVAENNSEWSSSRWIWNSHLTAAFVSGDAKSKWRNKKYEYKVNKMQINRQSHLSSAASVEKKCLCCIHSSACMHKIAVASNLRQSSADSHFTVSPRTFVLFSSLHTTRVEIFVLFLRGGGKTHL